MGKGNVFLFGAAVAALISSGASAAFSPMFFELGSFPSPSSGFATVAGALTSGQNAGRFVLWDGDTVFIEDGVAAGTFSAVATGIAGDPSFLAVHPDGKRVILGAGKCDSFGSGSLILVDTDEDVDDPGFTSLSSVETINSSPINHFSGVWISSSHLLLDACITSGSDHLVLVDVGPFFASGAEPVAKEVVSNKAQFSAFITADASLTSVFAADGSTGETHQLSVAALINAFNTDTPVDWTTPSADNVNLGAFSAGGPNAVLDDGTLVFGDFFAQVTFAFAPDYSTTTAVDPAGDAMNSYFVTYNPVTDRVLAVGANFVTFPPTMTGWITGVPAVPAASHYGLAAAACLTVFLGLVVLTANRKRRNPSR